MEMLSTTSSSCTERQHVSRIELGQGALLNKQIGETADKINVEAISIKVPTRLKLPRSKLRGI
jgi:hypothetical protein